MTKRSASPSRTSRAKIGRHARLLASVAVIALAATACTPKTALRGNLPRPHQIEQLEVGKQRKTQVESIMGSPSVIGTFDDNIWYYMSRRTEQWAFFPEEVVEQKVLALYFSNEGVLQHVETYTEDDAREIATSSRTTPTAGKELGVLEQIFGNVGKFGGNPDTGY
ncbi:outer membrane protein assembly factor BamE [Hwanghaeella grinnelliae]|uniref:Outer membrane protein assembly factor BamE n=1 Tax=Hwanghaeella grinnelliae TaxID=2500179 RepID=A0A437QYP8_9PROT|nr:outer membrane protein assembly factor BamE [Hwanghaeella grinnelliae]RVU39626.1 outer membrane protein assembly factor BamE [Hwanghaeella grinnelliae]